MEIVFPEDSKSWGIIEWLCYIDPKTNKIVYMEPTLRQKIKNKFRQYKLKSNKYVKLFEYGNITISLGEIVNDNLYG